MTDEQVHVRLIEWGQWVQGASVTGYPRTSTLHQSWQPGRGRGALVSAGAHGHEREREVHQAVKELPAKQRDAIYAHYVHRWPQGVAGEMLGCCAATLRARQAAARAAVAQRVSLRREVARVLGV